MNRSYLVQVGSLTVRCLPSCLQRPYSCGNVAGKLCQFWATCDERCSTHKKQNQKTKSPLLNRHSLTPRSTPHDPVDLSLKKFEISKYYEFWESVVSYLQFNDKRIEPQNHW